MIIKEELNNWRENEFQWLKATMYKKQVEEVIFNEVSNIFLDNEDIMDLQVTCEDI